MKCPNCSSHMFVSSESSGEKSQVTFFRCSICSSEHVSSEPKRQSTEPSVNGYFDMSSSKDGKTVMLV